MIALAAGITLVGVAATCISAALRPHGIAAFVLGGVVVACAEIIAVSHALSLVDAYRRSWFLASALVAAAAAGAVVAVVRPPWPVCRGSLAFPKDRLLATLGTVVLVELVYVTALAVGTPSTERDAISYHLTRALLWIQQGSIGYLPDATDARLSEFPANAEILQGATMLLSGSGRWAPLVQVCALVVSVVAIYGIARRIGFEQAQAAFGALLFATLPTVVLQAPTALNDLVVTAFATTAIFFVLGRSSADVVFASLSIALLVGTKGTGLVALPVVALVAIVRHRRGPQLVRFLAAGIVGILVGGAWYVRNAASGNGLFGTLGDAHRGNDDGILAIVARFTRYLVEIFELPGGAGRDKLLYAVAAGVLLIVGFGLHKGRLAVAAAALTLLPLLVLPAERVLHSVYFNGWRLVGFGAATELGIIRETTKASNVQSWYGPAGLFLALLALAIVASRTLRKTIPPEVLALAAAPIVFIAGVAYAVTYFDLNGRFAMGGVALSAATWGVVRPLRPVAVAAIAIATTTALLSLVNYREKPAGLDLLQGTDRESIWTWPREWAQSIEPEIARTIGFVDDHVPRGHAIAVSRAMPYPFALAADPDIVHRIVYADTLTEAARRSSEWAVLLVPAVCVDGWRLSHRSPPWGVFQRSDAAECDSSASWTPTPEEATAQT